MRLLQRNPLRTQAESMEPTESSARSAGALPLDPPLGTEEARVLGCLIEKEATTPEAYPLTLNAAVTACNQKTSRNPVMKLDPGRVGQALRHLAQRGLSSSEYGARAERWSHRLDQTLKVTAAQRTLLGLLLLRGPQTLAELYTRSERLHRFDDLDDVRYQLDRLAAHDTPMTVRLPRGPGQREDRYMHRLAGEIDPADWASAATSASSGADDGRIDELEQKIEALSEQVDALIRRVEEIEKR